MKATDALEILKRRYGKDANGRAGLEEERRRLALGRLIHRARTAQHLTQSELAKRVGTTQSAIGRIESADYDSLEVETLKSIAAALDALS